MFILIYIFIWRFNHLRTFIDGSEDREKNRLHYNTQQKYNKKNTDQKKHPFFWAEDGAIELA